jgi:NAD(P)-dependent dehydrogenase (short-subunit alcohol dehydrogenase family)
MERETFFITGANSGLGLALAEHAASAGHIVLGTVRSAVGLRVLKDKVPTAKPVILDVTNFDSIPGVVERAEAEHGPVDVLINNAGYGHEGIVEESSMDELRHQFDVNVFGAVAVAKAFIPRFRQRRRGFIVNVTSMAGMAGFPGVAFYCGSKFALQGISESLRAELAPFGIHVSALCPGSFRTDWAGRSMVRSERSVSDYDAFFEPIRSSRQERSGKQNGNPGKFAEAVLTLVQSASPPSQLLLGSDAFAIISDRIARLSREINEWKSLTESTDGID